MKAIARYNYERQAEVEVKRLYLCAGRVCFVPASTPWEEHKRIYDFETGFLVMYGPPPTDARFTYAQLFAEAESFIHYYWIGRGMTPLPRIDQPDPARAIVARFLASGKTQRVL